MKHFILLLFMPLTVHALSDSGLAQLVRDLDQLKGDAALQKIESALKTEGSGSDRSLLQYLKVRQLAKDSKWKECLNFSQEVLQTSSVMEEEIRHQRSHCLVGNGQTKDALAEDRRILDRAPHFRLRSEVLLRTSKILLESGKTKESLKNLRLLEKRARGTPSHPDLLLELVRAEKQAGGSSQACVHLRKLYRRAPLKSALADWGPDLAANEVDGQKTGCRNSLEDFRQRIRAFLWAGEDERARLEVQQVSANLARDNRWMADELRGWYLIQTGDVDEAFEILKSIGPERKSDPQFLMTFAMAAARSGNASAAIGAYSEAGKRLGGSASARKALFQAAFLSYQFQDYDGATRKFQDFVKKFPRSGLSQDARWHLAWISYLKGNHAEAFKKFSTLRSQARLSSSTRDRTTYWMAMSLLRQGKTSEAKTQFENLAEMKSGGYYSYLARQRLAKLPTTILAQVGPSTARPFIPFHLAEVLLPSSEARVPSSMSEEEAESEEALAAEIEGETREEADSVAEASEQAEEEAESDPVQETGRSEVAEGESDWPRQTPANARRLEKARALIRLGQHEDAKWELYEVEKKSRGRDEMRALMQEYASAGQWHRASSIAANRFAAQRISQGFDGARVLWEMAYPRAFEAEVKQVRSQNKLPEEFVWGIMRAESNYRRDAISPVGAMGLMQIMPGTGRRLASLQGQKEFQPTDLLQPPTAVKFGGFYLERLSRKLEDSYPLVAAAYNAGPHRVHSWLISFGQNLDMDEFVEHIPFLETRNYVKKVMTNSFIYAQLYGGKTLVADLASPVAVKGKPEFTKKENWDPL